MEAVLDEPVASEESVAVDQLPEVETPPADAPDYVREHYDAIREKEREVRCLEGEYLDAKEAAAEAKRDFESADKALRNLIARGPDPQKPLAFPEEPATPAADDAWKSAPLNELRMTEKQNDLFASAGVTTIGELEDLRAKIADGKAEWPKGIGPAKVTDIENRVVDWLDANRDKFGQPETSVTIEHVGHESVTLTPSDFNKLSKAIEKSGVA
jgi:hypothetical protein